MHKWLAIICLFILVGIAASQNPPSNAPKAGIAKSDSSGKGQKQPDGQPSNQASPPSVPSSPQPSTPTCDEACQNARKNLQIQNRLVWLTGGLVAVGLLQVGSMILQAWLLHKTRIDVGRQAKWMKKQAELMARQGLSMRRQTTLLRKSTDAAEKSAIAAMGISVPWLALHKFDFVILKGRENPLHFFQHPHVKIELKNHGQSPAILKRYGCSFTWEGKALEFRDYSFNLEEIVQSGGIYALDEGLDGPVPSEVVNDLVKGSKILVFSFRIEYGDVFGSPLKTLKFDKHLVEYDPDPTKMLVTDLENFDLADKPYAGVEKQQSKKAN